VTNPLATLAPLTSRSFTRLRMAILLGVTVLLLMVGGAWWSVSRNVQGLQAVAHTYEVLDQLNDMLVATLNTKAWGNSYALSGNQDYLTSYATAREQIASHFAKIRSLTQDNPRQQKRLDHLAPAFDLAATLQSQLIDLRRRNDVVAIPGFIPKSDAAVKRLRDMIEEMKAEEHRLLELRSDVSRDSESLASNISAIVVVATLLAGLLAVIAGVFLNRLLQRQIRAEQTRRTLEALVRSSVDPIVSKDLNSVITSWNLAAEKMFGYTAEEAVGKSITMIIPPDRLHEEDEIIGRIRQGLSADHFETVRIAKDGHPVEVEVSISPIRDATGTVIGASKILRDVSQRNRMTEALLKANADLETRAAALHAANKELETFSYSVSHDLRAPLRAIDGFSRVLEEEYADRLGETGRDCTKRIRKATQRMGMLIDDMLHLSRVTRAELVRREVDLSAIVDEKAQALQQSSPDRRVTFEIPSGLKAQGDSRLLGIAIGNLLENAWKFTSREPQTNIAFGEQQVNGSKAYFIRDNGVGFDMKYAGKLFGPFQRLHDDREFPGTGIGLATIQRIIGKHGGKIWAEAKPGEGATFYFTL
jgi:PAS domain S-box-containing protein